MRGGLIPRFPLHDHLYFTTFWFCDFFLSFSRYFSPYSTHTAGFAERLQNEIQQLDRGAHAICVVQDSQRRHAAWIGGSMLASLPTFGPLKVTRAEYEESPDTVHKKYF